MRRFKKTHKQQIPKHNKPPVHVPEKLEEAIIYPDPSLEENKIEELKEDKETSDALLVEQTMLSNNPYDLRNLDETLDSLDGPYCPLIYVNNEMYRWPSPYDVVLERTHDAIMEEDASEDIYIDGDQMIRYNYNYTLRNQAIYELSDACINAIEGVYDSFIEENLRDKFNYMRNGVIYKYNVDKSIANLYSIYNNISMNPMFSYWWDVMDNPNISMEEKNHLNTRYLLNFRDRIMDLIANKFTKFARETAFCEYVGYNYDITDINERDDFLNALSEEYQVNVTPEVFYSWQMGEYTCMIDTLSSMIEVILYQAVNNFNFMYFPMPPTDDIDAFDLLGE